MNSDKSSANLFIMTREHLGSYYVNKKLTFATPAMHCGLSRVKNTSYLRAVAVRDIYHVGKI